MAKEIVKQFKIQIKAGKATPAPPIGPILGQNGIPIPEFCNEFNKKTSGLSNLDIPVFVTVYKDRTYKMVIKKPTVASMIKNKCKIEKGSSTPNKQKVGKISMKDVIEIAQEKLEDLNTKNLDSAIRIVTGTAKSLGIEVVK
ncbi:MAG: 50S ribosomal protein L11 [Candidatus Dojkabacteria bacterium]|nr:50S ribosomal protein L11 [Candidatus Dojkabacteria bacterium]